LTAPDLWAEFREVLLRQPLAATELRPAPPEHQLADTARHLGVRTPEALVDLYRMCDGAHPEGPGHPGFFVFPPWWEWLPLEVVAEQGSWPVGWGRRADVEAFPFATNGSGDFLMADTVDVGRVWNASPEDGPRPAAPDGTLTGLLTSTLAAYAGTSADYRLEYVNDRMNWISSWEPEF